MPPQKPLLNPPMRGWLRDLPAPGDPPETTPGLFLTAPNHLDDVYLELPRSYLDFRGLVLYGAIVEILMGYWVFGWLFTDIEGTPKSLVLLAIVGLFVIVWVVIAGIRIDTAPPRDMPLRFNRQRRKVYAYEFKPVWWNPFTRWPVQSLAYNWDDVRAELWSLGGVTGGGMFVSKAGVVLSVVKPGTNEVIDRIQLRAKSADERAWAYICTYMQRGPQALPPSKWQPRDWNNEPTVNLARLLAPKVKWPVEMDIESRTAPSQHNCQDSEGCAVVGNVSVQGE
ncbi:DUF6708 domain-containing protein [Caballeronia sp. GAFFF1]|uniref:DUF6708 domain-containing protein n=1 Tax=Caballeronia sp. GAFFF1 TaxID=2921779 RepID=UPI002027F189|nr:DUF6708 domain-containing protein [Caballeronia sp. GAFFF1]